MEKLSPSELAERITARQTAMATHARELTAELSPSALAARARQDAAKAAHETRVEFETSLRKTVDQLKSDPRSLLTPEVRLGLGAAAATLALIIIVRLFRR